MTAPTDPPALPGGWRRLTGVLPVLGILLLAGALAAVALPSMRHQVALSLSRQQTPFVELYATPLEAAGEVGTTCASATTPGSAEVRFAVRSHLEASTKIAYRVRVKIDDLPVGQPRTGSFLLKSEEIENRTVEIGVPTDQAYAIYVVLPSSGQYLVLHCGDAA